jgi:outer membrane protein
LKKSSLVATTLFLGIAAVGFAQAQPPAKPPATPPAQAPPSGVPAQQAARPPSTPAVLPTKIAIINIGQAIQSTKEGQKAALEISNKYGPRKAEYDKRQQEIDQLTDQLNKGRATMSDAAQQKINIDIQNKAKDLKRFGEDSQAEMEADDAKIGQELQGKMGAIIQQYAIQNGYAVVLNAGEQQSPVLWWSAANWITDDIVKLYDQVHPVKETPAAPPTKK